MTKQGLGEGRGLSSAEQTPQSFAGGSDHGDGRRCKNSEHVRHV
jgi:hypothetical protein